MNSAVNPTVVLCENLIQLLY